MFNSGRKQFFNWLSTGIAGSSLALVIFIPSVTFVSETLKWLSFGFFTAAIPFAVAASAISKEVEVWGKGVTKATKGAHSWAILFSVFLYFIGFVVFFYEFGKYILLAFLAAVVLSVLLYRLSQNDLSKP